MSRRPEAALVRINNKVGTISKMSLSGALELEPALIRGFLFAKMNGLSSDTNVDVAINLDTNENAKSLIKAWVTKANNVEIRTPLTIAGVLQWARKEVKENPTRKVEKYNSKLKKIETKEVKNTVNNCLIQLLLGQLHRSLDGYKSYELCDIIEELHTSGVVGYENMSQRQLLSEIDDEILVNQNQEQVDDLEDLLNILFED